MEIRKPFLAMMTGLLALTQAADARSVAWEHDGIDSEWITSGNWDNKGSTPGTTRPDIAVFAGGRDQGEVNTTVRSDFPVDITMRNGSSLMIGADMESIQSFRIASTPSSGTTTLSHTAGTVGASGFLDLGVEGIAVYDLSGTAVLNLADRMIVYKSGVFSMSGSMASVTAGGSGLSIEGAGELQFTLDARGVGTIATTGSFSVDQANSILTIDASAFKGTGSFDLVTYESLEGRGFAKDNVSITGLGADRTGSVTYESQRMNLAIKAKAGAKGHYVDIPEPETYPLFVGLAMMAYVMVCGRRR